MSEIAHPRDVARLQGCEAAEDAFVSALERGRLHHAWLLVGPEGVGKATFAYRAARRLLGARPAPEFGVLGADPDDPVFRQVAGRAHPDARYGWPCCWSRALPLPVRAPRWPRPHRHLEMPRRAGVATNRATP